METNYENFLRQQEAAARMIAQEYANLLDRLDVAGMDYEVHDDEILVYVD